MHLPIKKNPVFFKLIIAAAAWIVPGGGHFLMNQKRRAVILFIAVTLTFLIGLFIGSVGVIDPVGAWPWYIAQIMTSPIVAYFGHLGGSGLYPVYGKPREIGQLYTTIAGLLNLLCIINALYRAHMKSLPETGETQ